MGKKSLLTGSTSSFDSRQMACKHIGLCVDFYISQEIYVLFALNVFRLSVCLSVCLSLCLSVCLSVSKLLTNCDETFWKGGICNYM